MKEEDFKEWKLHPVTRELLKLFEAEILEQGLRWTRGEFLKDKTEEIGVLGRLAGYRALIELDWEAVQGMEAEATQQQQERI